MDGCDVLDTSCLHDNDRDRKEVGIMSPTTSSKLHPQLHSNTALCLMIFLKLLYAQLLLQLSQPAGFALFLTGLELGVNNNVFAAPCCSKSPTKSQTNTAATACAATAAMT